MKNRQALYRIKSKKDWAERVLDLQRLVENKKQNTPGAGRKKLKINDQVYPLLKKAMLKAAETGGDTSLKRQCSEYRKIAKKLGFKNSDIPEEVSSCRMQRFDAVLNFRRRACNQKKSNRKSDYQLNRISRYLKDVIKKNIAFACDVLEA